MKVITDSIIKQFYSYYTQIYYMTEKGYFYVLTIVNKYDLWQVDRISKERYNNIKENNYNDKS